MSIMSTPTWQRVDPLKQAWTLTLETKDVHAQMATIATGAFFEALHEATSGHDLLTKNGRQASVIAMLGKKSTKGRRGDYAGVLGRPPKGNYCWPILRELVSKSASGGPAATRAGLVTVESLLGELFSKSASGGPAATRAGLVTVESASKLGDGNRATARSVPGAPREGFRGYLVVTSPFEDSYATACALPGWIEFEENGWTSQWMGGPAGRREIANGKLFKHIYAADGGLDAVAGSLLLTNWDAELGLVHPDTARLIAHEWALVIPVRFQRRTIGFLVLDVSAECLLGVHGDKRLSTPTQYDSELNNKAIVNTMSYLYAAAQCALAPLLIEEATIGSYDLMDTVVRGLEPPMRRTYAELWRCKEVLDACRSPDLPDHVNVQLRDVSDTLVAEASRGLGHINALSAKDPAPGSTTPLHEAAWQDLMWSAWLRVLHQEAEAGFGSATCSSWLRTGKMVAPESRTRVGVSRILVEDLLREILSNAYHFTCDAWNDLPLTLRGNSGTQSTSPSWPARNVSASGNRNTAPSWGSRAPIEAFFGIASVESGEARTWFVIENWTLRNSPHIRARSLLFGFSGRPGGSGWGLAIVRRKVQHAGGHVQTYVQHVTGPGLEPYGAQDLYRWTTAIHLPGVVDTADRGGE